MKLGALDVFDVDWEELTIQADQPLLYVRIVPLAPTGQQPGCFFAPVDFPGSQGNYTYRTFGLCDLDSRGARIEFQAENPEQPICNLQLTVRPGLVPDARGGAIWFNNYAGEVGNDIVLSDVKC